MAESTVAKMRKGFIAVVLWFYMGGAIISGSYFNWQYAKENGFVSWLLLGEFVPTLQSLIWPYYAVSSLLEKGWTREEKDNLAHYERATAAINKAVVLLDGFAVAEKMAEPDKRRVVDLLAEALEESTLVRDDVLAKVHPDFPKMYRDKCVSGTKRLLNAIETGQADVKESAEIRRLGKEFHDWARAHEKDFRIPKDTPK